MVHPSQFEVNEAWIAFRLNRTPIQTEAEGSFNCFALMDAASCFILSTELVPLDKAEPSSLDWRRLMKKGGSHKQQLPKTIYVAIGEVAESLCREAALLKIDILRVAESDLRIFLGEARDGFEEHVGGRTRGA
jgi:hypothetical protein